MRKGTVIVMQVSMLIIAIVNVVLMAVVVVMLLRVARLMTATEDLVRKHGVPLIDKLHEVADDVKHMSREARQVEERVAGAASMVIDQVEPPIRHAAAVLAGVRAGVGRIFAAGQRANGTGVGSRFARKE
jgi:hypothetical protein